MKNLAKIDKFYYLFGVVLLVVAILIIVTLRGIFSALSIAGQVDEELLQTTTPRINKTKIDQALEFIGNKDTVPLDLGI